MFSLANIAVLIPAAGNSSRMGRPKQLLPWKESTLLGKCIHIAKSITDLSALAKLLLDKGVDREQIEVIGMGNREPIESNNTSEGRAKNRRVEIVVVTDGRQ